MKARVVPILAALACAACATIAGVEVTRPADVAPDDSDESDGGAGAIEHAESGAPDAADASSPLACGCDAGWVCCLGAASAACAAPDPSACAAPGALALGCARPDDDGRACCWNADGGLHATSFAASCAAGRAACAADDDCATPQEICHTRACGAATIGLCAPPDAAAAATLACP